MRPILIFVLSLLLLFPSVAQQTSTNSIQGSTILQQSLRAQMPPTTISDVTLTGTARRIAGSDDESGSAVLKALASGASRVDLTLSSGQHSEILNTSVAPAAGSWSGPDGVPHAIAFHNLLTSPTWFFPAFTIAQGLSASTYIVTYVGAETHNGQPVQHVSLSQPSLLPATSGGLSSAHLTQVDLFLDAATFLPSAIEFNIHPDNNALVDIPVEVRFSDYRPVNGAQVPFHVQQYLNNTLNLDFQADSVTLNNGLSGTIFTVQAGL